MNKVLLILVMFLITGCGTDNSVDLVFKTVERCKPGNTITIKTYTGIFGLGVEVSCTWIKEEEK